MLTSHSPIQLIVNSCRACLFQRWKAHSFQRVRPQTVVVIVVGYSVESEFLFRLFKSVRLGSNHQVSVLPCGKPFFYVLHLLHFPFRFTTKRRLWRSDDTTLVRCQSAVNSYVFFIRFLCLTVLYVAVRSTNAIPVTILLSKSSSISWHRYTTWPEHALPRRKPVCSFIKHLSSFSTIQSNVILLQIFIVWHNNDIG